MIYLVSITYRCMAPALLSPITKGSDQRKKCPFDQPDLLTQVLLSSPFTSSFLHCWLRQELLQAIPTYC